MNAEHPLTHFDRIADAPDAIPRLQRFILDLAVRGKLGGDALHLALASYHKCDFLVTWNCRHLANANKFGHIRRVNTMLGLFVPALVTPLELFGGSDETESE